jgi:hypothetical protein
MLVMCIGAISAVAAICVYSQLLFLIGEEGVVVSIFSKTGVKEMKAFGHMWSAVDADTIPAHGRWDVPEYLQGQIVEYAFLVFGSDTAGTSEPFMRVTDASDQTVSHWRKVKRLK